MDPVFEAAARSSQECVELKTEWVRSLTHSLIQSTAATRAGGLRGLKPATRRSDTLRWLRVPNAGPGTGLAGAINNTKGKEKQDPTSSATRG